MNTKNIKKKSALRVEAIIPILIIVVTIFVYTYFFFDSHLKDALEFVGYEVLGAEVNIANVETSFTKGSIRIQGIELTNPDRPEYNMVKIGDIRFGVLWDGLLRARIVIEEMAVEQIEISSKRSHIGKVKPPPPPPPLSTTDNSALKKEASKFEKTSVNVLEKKYKDNFLGDIAGMLGGQNKDGSKNDGSGINITDIQNSLPSKKALEGFEKELQDKQKKWDEKFKSLPQSKDIEAIGQKLSQVKTSNFKSPQEFAESLQKIQAIIQEADSKLKIISTTATEFTTDLNALNSRYKEIDNQIKTDIAELESKLRIPKIDGKSLSRSILEQYLSSYVAKFAQYKPLIEKLSPKNKGSDPEFQPRPRSKGVSYEFGKPNSYPALWIKKISISSVPSANASKNLGAMKGSITDISSNQILTHKPTVIKFDGDFPGLDISGLSSRINIDNRQEDSLIEMNFAIAKYGIDGRELVSNSDGKISFKKAFGGFKSAGTLKALTLLDLKMDNSINNIDYDVSASSPVLDEILKNVFNGIPTVSIDAKASGDLPEISFDINSNIGSELQKGLEKQINKKIDEMKAKLNAAITQAIGDEKTKVDRQIGEMKSQYEGQLKKIQDQINTQKTKAEKQATQSKNETQKQGEKQLQDAAQKKLDELKKQFGF